MQDGIVIVGVGVVSPLGEGMQALGEGLRTGRTGWRRDEVEGLGALPLARCGNADDVAGEDRTITFARHCVGQIAAGGLGTVAPERRGAFAATSKGEVLSLLAGGWPQLPTRGPDALARWIACDFDARGPVEARVAACATGAHNLIAAADALRGGTVDFAIAGCSEATLHPLYLASFAALGLLTPDACRPYDARRNGFAVGEGAALFAMCRRELATALGLPVLARVTGWATGSDAYATTAMNPDGKLLAHVARKALAMARIDVDSRDYIQAHGTATASNDTAELAFARELCGGRVPLVSLKGALGHLMGAASGVELAACIASLHDGFIPGTAGFEEPADASVRIQREPESRAVHRILKIASGFGGQVAAVVLQSAQC